MLGNSSGCLFQCPSLNLRGRGPKERSLGQRGWNLVMRQGSRRILWAPRPPMQSSELCSGRARCCQGRAWALLPPSPNHLKSQLPLLVTATCRKHPGAHAGAGETHPPTKAILYCGLLPQGRGGACLSKPHENTGLQGLAHLPLVFECKFS